MAHPILTMKTMLKSSVDSICAFAIHLAPEEQGTARASECRRMDAWYQEGCNSVGLLRGILHFKRMTEVGHNCSDTLNDD
eukprot:SAG31_NODE_23243_length_508_cov_0.880196_1_plen_80_part_00